MFQFDNMQFLLAAVLIGSAIAAPTNCSNVETSSGRPIESTIIHEPPTQDPDTRVSTPSPQQPEGHSEEAVPPESVVMDNDTTQSTKTLQDAAKRAAVLESLVQEMVMLDQGSLDRLYLCSEWRWFRGAGGQVQGRVEE